MAGEERAYGFLYLPDVDSLMHVLGPDAPEADALFDETLTAIDTAVRGGSFPAGTLLLLTSDHGMAAVSPERTTYVNVAWPEIAGHLAVGADGLPLAPAGSCRDLFLHVRPGETEQVVSTLGSLLEEVADVHAVDDLVAQGASARSRRTRYAGDLRMSCACRVRARPSTGSSPAASRTTSSASTAGCRPTSSTSRSLPSWSTRGGRLLLNPLETATRSRALSTVRRSGGTRGLAAVGAPGVDPAVEHRARVEARGSQDAGRDRGAGSALADGHDRSLAAEVVLGRLSREPVGKVAASGIAPVSRSSASRTSIRSISPAASRRLTSSTETGSTRSSPPAGRQPARSKSGPTEAARGALRLVLVARVEHDRPVRKDEGRLRAERVAGDGNVHGARTMPGDEVFPARTSSTADPSGASSMRAGSGCAKTKGPRLSSTMRSRFGGRGG